MPSPPDDKTTRHSETEGRPPLVGRRLGPYEILGELGAGGMGVVYRATDTRLGRAVALKLLPAEFTGDAERLRRFEAEARHASSLNHPNILTVYDIGAEGDTHFIATELVEGETLRSRLSRGPLPADEAVRVAAQIADALEAAHEAGIVHRDIKPENVMVRRRDGYVKVLDFGLAKLAETRTAEGASSAATLPQTRLGSVVGTPAYMSPEHARGLKVDARTDVWSLGCVLHEMLAGRRPFEGETEGDVRAAILRDEPRPLPPHVPVELSRIVTRALAKSRDERYSSAAAVAADLQKLRAAPAGAHATRGDEAPTRLDTPTRTDATTPARNTASPSSPPPASRAPSRAAAVALVAAVVAAAVAAAAYIYFRPGTAATGRAIDSLAVLPFQNAGGDPETEYFSDGITESLINSLSELPNLRVVSRNSAFRFKGRAADAGEAARQLNVRAVLTGRVTQRSDQLLISAQLTDTAEDRQLWGAQYNRKLADIFAVQEEIAREISEKLRLRLSGEERKLLTKRYTENAAAYQLYLKCTYYWNKFTPEAERAAIDHCTQAIVLDPDFALPYAGLVHAYQVSANNGWMRPHDAYPKAKAALAKGLELNPNDPSLLTAAASTSMFYDWDWEAAERGFRRANEVEPNYWHHHELYGYLLTVEGRAEEAFAEGRRAQEIDPLSLIAHASVSHFYYFFRQYDRSTAEARKSLELDPKFAVAHLQLARTFAQQGKYEEAVAEYKQVIGLMGLTAQTAGELGHTYALSGNRAEALKLLGELKEMSARQYVSPLNFVFIHIGLGDKERALEYLEKSYEERATWLMWIKVDPRLDPLRPDPRFQDILRRMKL
jgi:serine/threonine protein kinase/Flp pilus assembly protein TadD